MNIKQTIAWMGGAMMLALIALAAYGSVNLVIWIVEKLS